MPKEDHCCACFLTFASCWAVILSLLIWNSRSYYANLDTVVELQFTPWAAFSVGSVGYYHCKSDLCPTQGLINCVWNTESLECDADLPMNLEISNPKMTCQKPYGNWVTVHTCELTYDVKPRTRSISWYARNRSWILASSLIGLPLPISIWVASQMR